MLLYTVLYNGIQLYTSLSAIVWLRTFLCLPLVSMRELSAAAIGHALTAMGFEYKLIHGIRRYRVVSLTDAEKKQYRHLPDEGGEGGEVE